MLIITGCGRSGTKFASELFLIEHEPRPSDFQVVAECFDDKERSLRYIEDIFKGDERESNSNLAVHIRAIKELFPKATIIHLIRNPIDTISSFMSTSMYDLDSETDRHHIRLLEDESWDKMSRFEKCCHYWVEVNKRLRRQELPHLRLEDLGGEPVNVGTKEFTRSDWTEEHIGQCRNICQEEANYYGYKITI